MKVLFMGTPGFAVPSLKAVLESKSHTVVGVVTQPDRAVKRGKIEMSAVKQVALENGLPVVQPARIADEVESIKKLGADIAVTAAYGQLLTESVLGAFPHGVINVHASLLPKYRGASPIYSAILNGDEYTGVTIMQTELGLDSGDIFAAERLKIGADENAGELTERLAELGAKLLLSVLDGIEKNEITAAPQDSQAATKCRTVKKHEQYIDFNRDAAQVVNQIRALSPAPCAKTVIDGETYKVYAAKCADCSGAAGEILKSDGKIIVACASGAVELLTVQAPGKRALSVAEFTRGKKITVGTICGAPQQ